MGEGSEAPGGGEVAELRRAVAELRRAVAELRREVDALKRDTKADRSELVIGPDGLYLFGVDHPDERNEE